MLFRRNHRKDVRVVLESACQPVIERMEDRRMFSESTIQSLPFVLDFTSDRGELADKDGQGTGFTRVQVNKNGNQYQPANLDLDTAAGVLKVTTTGTSTAGGNYGTDNTLTNALETQFDGTTSGWKVTTRVKGPIGFIDTPSEQAGVTFGPDQDNYIKFVAIAQGSQQYLQFTDEQSASTHTLSQLTTLGVSFASINSLDLQLQGDAATGIVTAFYSVNGGAFVKSGGQVALSGAKYNAFFNSASRAGIIAMHKNNTGPMTVSFDEFKIEGGTIAAPQPRVTASRPGNGETNVSRDAFVAADVFLPTAGAGVDASTLSSSTVLLYRTSDHSPVGVVMNTSGGGDAIVLTPTSLLDPNTSYTFEVTSGLKDSSGAAFQPYTATFTTGVEGGDVDSTLAFVKVALPETQGTVYSGITKGPDGRMYASTIDGQIHRFNIGPAGELTNKFVISSLQTKEGGPRILIGMTFDAAGNMWVSHNQFTDYTVGGEVADDFTGKISKLSGTNYSTVTTMVVNLPRSVRDHMTNQLVFGPDGALYFNQGANTAMGAPDNAWGLRQEHLLNAAVLRLDPSKLGATPLDVKTPDAGGTYNPFNANNALTIYATGVRNAYDMVWTSAGKLFVAANGSAAGGNAPGTPASPYSFGANQRIDFATNGAYTGPNIPAVNNGPTQNDYIFNIVQGGYYGQPNPSRGEFVLNGGNPTAGIDFSEVTAYPVGTQPDRNYRGNITGSQANTKGSAYVFGKNYSPDGIIEYKSDSFGGLLKGKLMVAEYSGGDEIAVLTPDANGNIVNRQTGIAGLTHFVDPLDLTEDPSTGFLYVIEFSAARITLVRPITPGANASPDKSQMVFNDPTSAGATPPQKLTITNVGTSQLSFGADAFSITGTNASQFTITQKPLPGAIDPGESIDVFVTFTAGSGDTDLIKTANLTIKTNDATKPNFNVSLRGLGTSGTGGANEPSLQQLMNLYRIPISVGDTSPLDTDLNNPPAQPNNEVVMQSLVKAGQGPVTIESLAVFGVASSSVPTFRFGYYTPGNKNDLFELMSQTGTAGGQSVNPNMVGSSSFDPGSAAFGLYTYWQNFSGKPTVYSEDQLNKTYDADTPRHVRFYPLKDVGGAVVPDAYIFAFEEFNTATDVQDYVGIIRNVKVAPGATAGPEIGFENNDGVPFSDRLVFNKIQDFTTTGLPNNIFHDKSVLTIRNTGQSTLTISNMVASAGWTLVGAPTTPFNIAPGGSQNVTVQFTANPGGSSGQILSGTLTITSNDADEPNATIQLSGHWQPQNEGNDEPNLQQIVNVFGYKTTVGTNAQLNPTGFSGQVRRVADEVLSPYWHRADASAPVSIRQIASYHSQGNVATAFWHNKGSNTTTTIFTMDGEEAQSLLPHKNNSSTGVVGTDFAAGTFSPTGSFGLKIDGEWSDPTKNIQEKSGGGYGHHVRFWVLRDRAGKIIPNTYLMSMDYSGINYDYQDNIFIVSNIQPDSAPSVPAGLTASGAGISLNWNDNTEANLAGYNVYRATTSGGTYTKLNAVPLMSSDYLDGATSIGSTYFYKVTALDNAGNESAQTAFVQATRTSDQTPPGAPAGLVATGTTSGVSLDWANNPEGDVAGYNIYRSSSAAGPFTTKLNVNPVGLSAYVDTTAPVGVISYYKVTAVDSSGNEGAGAFANATRAGNDTTKPAAPSGVVTTPSAAGISIDWANNSEQDLAGYNIYRSPDGVNNWTKLNTSGLLASSLYNDTTAAVGQNFYRVTAVDTSNNESDPLAFNATRPPTDTFPPLHPSNLTAVDSPSGINLNWDDNTETDLAGYNVYRSSTLNGTYAKLNLGGLVLTSNYLDATANAGVNFYQVRAVDSSGNEGGFAQASTAHVVSFTHADIGNPAPAGSLQTITQNKDYNLLAGGTDVYNTSDSFGFAYQQITGDFDFVVRLAGLTNTNALAKGGLMARESLAANSRNIFAYATPTGGGGYRTTYRANTGGSTSATGTGPVSYPNTWIRLSRTGNTFASFRSTDGTNWTPLASTTLNVGNTMYVGMAAVSKNASALTTAQFRDLANLKAPVDEKPAPPTQVEAIGDEEGIVLRWRTSAPDLKHVNVYRSNAVNGTYSLVAQVIAPQNVYVDRSAPQDATSYYHFTAVDLGDQESEVSTFVSAFRAIDLPPSPPENLEASESNYNVLLTWDYPSDNSAGEFNLYRSDAVDGTYTKLNTQVLRQTYYDDFAALDGDNFYRLYSVDGSGDESLQPATVSVFHDAPPAQPKNFIATATSEGIELKWDANTEPDLQGYQLERSTDFEDWTPLGELLTFTAFKDTFAQPGVQTFYRLYAVDEGFGASTAAIASATRPAVQPTIKINFQSAGSPTVAGYEQDNGNVFADRGNGLNYGWSGNFANNARDRNLNSDQLLDTLMQFWTGSSWSIALANGNYSVKVSIGDSQYASTHTLNVNGTTVFDDQALAKNQFMQQMVNVTVTNGRLMLDAVGQIANQATRINYIEITPL